MFTYPAPANLMQLIIRSRPDCQGIKSFDVDCLLLGLVSLGLGIPLMDTQLEAVTQRPS